MNPEQAFQEKAHLFATCNHLLSESKLDDKSASKLIGCTVRKIKNIVTIHQGKLFSNDLF